MGGDCIGSDLVKLSTGVDFVKGVIDVCCGVKPSFKPTGEPCVAAVRFIFSEKDLAALEAIRRQSPESLYRVSDILPIDGHEICDSSTRYGYYILTAKTQDEMQKLLDMSGLDSLPL